MATNGPLPMLILPDGILTGRDSVVSVTSEAEPFCAPAVAGTTNYGDLVPIFTSVALSTEYAFDARLQRAGGVYSLAEWIWKNQTDAETTFRGVDEVRYINNPFDPYDPIGSTHPSPSKTSVIGACYANRIGKIFLYLIGPSFSVVYCRHRDIGGDPNNWTLTTFSLGPAALKEGQEIGIEVLEMADGTLRMLVVTGGDGVTDNDISVYSSTDGLTWGLAARDVFSKSYGATAEILRMRAAVSGDWVRMVIMDAAAPTLRTFVSSDRCATFSYLDGSDLTGADAPESNGNTVDEYGHIDIEGIGDATGTFVLGYRSGANGSLKGRVAGRDADWGEVTTLLSVVGEVMTACLVNDGMRLYYFATDQVPGAGNPIRLGAKYVALDKAIEDLSEPANTKYSQWKTYARYLPAYLTAVRADPGFALIWGLVNPDSAGAALGSSSALVYGRQWTARSLWKYELDDLAVSDEFIILRWDTAVGPPNRGGSLTTPAARFAGASGAEVWRSDRHQMQSDATGAAGRVYYAYNEGATGSWVDDGPYIGWIVGALTSIAFTTSVADRSAVRIKALSNPVGTTLDFSVRIGPVHAVVYDNNAATALATLSANLWDGFWQFRVGMSAGTTLAEISVAPVSNLGSAAAWVSAAVTLTSAVGATFQGYEWGHLSGLSGLSSHWRRIEHDDDSNCHQYGFSNPTVQRGAPCAAQPIYVSKGVYASWSGGAGFEEDRWTAEPRHLNEIDNLFLPSPDAPWKGSSMTTQSIVFTADPDDSTKFLDHGGLAVFGTSTHRMTVEYNGTNTWGGPAYSAAVTNDLTPALRVSGLSNGYVDVTGMTLDDGQYVGKYARTLVTGLVVTSLRIDRQVGNRLYLDAAGTANATRAFASGSSLWIHDDKFVVEHPTRQVFPFMRLTFPCPPGTTTATLDIRAGTLVAGPTLDFPAAIAWAHTQVEEPNQEIFAGEQGLRWGYQLGKSRRGMEGTIVGDAAKSRRVLANQLRHLTQFAVRPLVFAWDADDLQRSAMLARYDGAVERAEAGWRQASDGTWYSVGDMTLRFSEEL